MRPAAEETIMRSMPVLAGAFIAALTVGACAQTAEKASGAELKSTAELGRWLTASGNLEIEIAPCGKALCGTVVRVVANNSMVAPGSSMKTADGQPALGKAIMTDFTPAGDGEWEGHIYNRENGETYACVMSLVAPDQLKVRPYKVMHLFGQTQIWQRVARPAG
jgi:uncharacterized protein (DUF2147 family)